MNEVGTRGSAHGIHIEISLGKTLGPIDYREDDR